MGLSPAQGLSTLLTVEGLLFATVGVLLSAAGNTALARRRAERQYRRVLVLAAALLGLVACGAIAAWHSVFVGHWPRELDEQMTAVCIAGGIVGQPGIAVLIAWLVLRKPKVRAS